LNKDIYCIFIKHQIASMVIHLKHVRTETILTKILVVTESLERYLDG